LNPEVDWKGLETVMTVLQVTAQLAIAAIVFIGPLVVLAVAAIRFGADSRPTVDDCGPHRWVPGG
jgi:hypothetical protein